MEHNGLGVGAIAYFVEATFCAVELLKVTRTSED